MAFYLHLHKKYYEEGPSRWNLLRRLTIKYPKPPQNFLLEQLGMEWQSKEA